MPLFGGNTGTRTLDFLRVMQNLSPIMSANADEYWAFFSFGEPWYLDGY